MSRSEPTRARRVLRIAGLTIGLFLLCSVGLQLLAGPAGIPDGWRPTTAPPAPLSTSPLSTSPLSTGQGPFDLSVSPIEARVDEPIQILVTGLHPGEEVILRARTLDAQEVEFQAWARFRANDEGRVDPTRSAPIEGTYSSSDGSGLLWSMGVEGDPPFYTSRSWARREVRLSAETERGVRRVAIERLYPWNDLHFETLTGDGIEAELWMPQGTDRLPAVIKLSGFGDGASPLDSSLIADRGFAVLDLGYHARPGLPGDLVEIPIETVARAIDWLQRHDRIDQERIGIFGASKGAELALLAASADPRIRAVAAWAPSSVVFAGISFRDPSPGSSWTIAGVPHPFVSPPFSLHALRSSARLALRRPVAFGPTYEQALDLAIEQKRDDVFLAVEEINGPILLAAGSDDQMWPSARMTRQIVERLERADFPHRVVTVIEEGTGHSLDYSLWPAGGGPSRTFVRGGTPESSHRGGARAWRTTLDFLRESLAVKSQSGPHDEAIPNVATALPSPSE